MRNNNVRYTAICGMFAGVAITIMCLGGFIPIATYVTPMLCIIIAQIILSVCGSKFAWIWYVSVSLLSIMLAPDKEAALLFVFLGSYPCMKRMLDRSKLRFLWKLLYFNAMIGVFAFLISTLLGLQEIRSEYRELGTIGFIILIILGNITFILLDRVLSFRFKKRQKPL